MYAVQRICTNFCCFYLYNVHTNECTLYIWRTYSTGITKKRAYKCRKSRTNDFFGIFFCQDPFPAILWQKKNLLPLNSGGKALMVRHIKIITLFAASIKHKNTLCTCILYRILYIIVYNIIVYQLYYYWIYKLPTSLIISTEISLKRCWCCMKLWRPFKCNRS